MNVIFLDFDGVLIPQGTDHYSKKVYDRPIPSGFDQNCIGNLNILAETFDAKVVLLTNWRKLFGAKACALMLAAAGYSGGFVTPEDVGVGSKVKWWDLDAEDHSHNVLGCPFTLSSSKSNDLGFWLDGYSDYVTGFVVLEDFDLSDRFSRNHVRCELGEGLTDDKLEEAMAVLART